MSDGACHPVRVENGRLLVDAPTEWPDGTEVPLELCFEFRMADLTPDQRAAVAGYEGRNYTGKVMGGRLVVDEPTVLPDGISILFAEVWPLPPEEQARLDASLKRGLEEADAGKGILADDVIEEMRIKHGLPAGERTKFEAQYRAELERRFEQAVPGGHVTMQDFLARWKTHR